MFVISIIYIFMIKRRKYIIFGLQARVDMISVARTWWLALVSKSGRRSETFIGQDGGGEPLNTRWSFDTSSFLTGHCSRKCTTSNLLRHLCWILQKTSCPRSLFCFSFFFFLHDVLCSSSATRYGLIIGPLQIVWSCNDRNSRELKPTTTNQNIFLSVGLFGPVFCSNVKWRLETKLFFLSLWWKTLDLALN